MNTITVYKSEDGHTLYTKKHSDSELLLSHLLHGEGKYYEGIHDDVVKLAKAHGWSINVVES